MSRDHEIDENIVDSTFVKNILEDLDVFVGGKKRKLPDNTKPTETQVVSDSLRSSSSIISIGSNIERTHTQDLTGSPSQLDLIAARARIIRLESELHSIERDSKRARYEQELELITNYPNSVKLQLEFDELKQKYQTAKDKSEESDKSRRSIENEWKQTNSVWKREKLQFQSELTELKHDLRATKSELDFLNQQKEIDITTQELKYSELEQKYLEQVELLEKANTRLEEELAPVLSKFEECENKCRKLERDIQQREDDAHIFACVKDKLPNLIKAEKKYLQLQGDNQILMDRCREFELIRERAIDFEAKYTRIESRMRELSSVITENSHLKQALQKWEKFDSAAITHMGFGSPDTLIRKYCDMQQQLVLLTEKSGDLQTTLTISESRLDSVSRELCEVKSELAIEKANFNIKNEQCQKLERKLVYIKMDRDSYPKLIKSYDKASFSHSSEDELLKVRVERSEQNLARAEERIKELEREFENIQNVSNSSAMELTTTNSQVSSLMIELESKTKSLARIQSKMEWLEQQNKICQQENKNLELQLTSKTQELKIMSSLENKSTEEEAPRQIWVHFKRNNLSNAREEKLKELLKLRTENKELRLTIENGEYSSDDLVHKKEVDQLKDRLKYADVMENRLKESFSKRITEFREVCNMLTGYRIDAQPGGRYKIRSVYAESADDYLEFVISQGNLSLLPTSYSDLIQSKVTLYLSQHSSLPCLTSDITMELYKKCTLFLDS